MKQVELKDFLKKRSDSSMTIATAKMELYVALANSFRPLTNFTRTPTYGMGVLNALLEYYNIF